MLPCVEKAEHERAAKFCELRMQRNINATDRTDAASNGADRRYWILLRCSGSLDRVHLVIPIASGQRLLLP